MDEFKDISKGGTIRGLGCGKPKPSGKIAKLCVDCGQRVEVEVDERICPLCSGPLTSSYDE